MSRRHASALLALLLLATAAGLYLGLAGGEDGTTDASGRASARAGEGARLAIPADTASFATLDGDSASVGDLSGRVVVLNLWGTWCPPCRREIPHLVDLQREIEPRGGTVVGLAVASGSREDVRAFVERYSVNYPVWLSGTREVVRRFDVMGFPTTLVLDREGVIRERFLGPQTEARLLEAVEPLLAGS